MSKTTLLIHGAWLTPAIWKPWIDRYEAQGHTVAPAWPFMDRPVAERGRGRAASVPGGPRCGFAAGLFPGIEAAGDMGDVAESHVLQRGGGQRRAPATAAEEDEALVLLEDRLGIGAFRVDPELQHAARRVEAPGTTPSRSRSRLSRLSMNCTSSRPCRSRASSLL